MKKLAILFSASLFCAYSAIAEMPQVKLGGTLHSMAGYRDQKGNYKFDDPSSNTGNQHHSSAFANDAKIKISADGKFNSTKYGALLKLNADAGATSADETGNADKNMFYIQNDKIGRFEFGNYPGAGAMLEMDIDNFEKGAYGHEGYWSSWVNKKTSKEYNYGPFGAISGTLAKSNLLSFMRTPNMPTNYLATHYSDATKATFYTVPAKGLTMGISYIPDLDSTGTIATISTRNGGNTDGDRKILGQSHPALYKEIFSGGIRYEFDITDFKIKTTATGEVGHAKTKVINKLRAWEIGAQIRYGSYGIASTYGDWGRTTTLKEKLSGTKQGASYWTLNAMHDVSDKLGYSISYMHGKKAGGMELIGNYVNTLAIATKPQGGPLTDAQKRNYSDVKYNTLNNIIFDIDYKLADGFVPFASVARFAFKEAESGKGNKGVITLLGTKINF